MKAYNGFVMELFENAAGRWRVQVRREDGCDIETSEGAYETVTTDIESKSVGEAVAIAKAIIDIVLAEGTRPTRH
jgi:hypothetical protein